MKKIKIILVDDHQIFRDGIKAILSEVEDMEVIAEAGDANQLFSFLNIHTPDIIVLDLSLPGISGLETIKTLKEKYPCIKILVLSMHNTEEFIINSIHNGAKGYLPKDTSKNELLEAIYSLADDHEYFGKQITSTILRSYIRKSFAEEGFVVQNAKLTQRELEIIRLLSRGLTSKEIAKELFISIKTVDCHKNHILQKLRLKNSVELIMFAIKNKLIELE
jgi:DNA-binding NarL/FixJ family response regulator